MVADVAEMITDAVGLSSFSFSALAVVAIMALASQEIPVEIMDAIPLFGSYLSFAAVAVDSNLFS